MGCGSLRYPPLGKILFVVSDSLPPHRELSEEPVGLLVREHGIDLELEVVGESERRTDAPTVFITLEVLEPCNGSNPLGQRLFDKHVPLRGCLGLYVFSGELEVSTLPDEIDTERILVCPSIAGSGGEAETQWTPQTQIEVDAVRVFRDVPTHTSTGESRADYLECSYVAFDFHPIRACRRSVADHRRIADERCLVDSVRRELVGEVRDMSPESDRVDMLDGLLPCEPEAVQQLGRTLGRHDDQEVELVLDNSSRPDQPEVPEFGEWLRTFHVRVVLEGKSVKTPARQRCGGWRLCQRDSRDEIERHEGDQPVQCLSHVDPLLEDKS